MTTHSNFDNGVNRAFGVSSRDAQAIRAQLRLRYNEIIGSWQVYTTIHGTGIFRWMTVSKETKQWYLDCFPQLVVCDVVENHMELHGAMPEEHSTLHEASFTTPTTTQEN